MLNKNKEANFKIELGSEVKDIITGFSGIIVARAQWIHACNTYAIKSRSLKDNKPMDNQWFDEPQLELIKKDVVKKDQTRGGPCIKVPQTNR